jgi:predicted metal-dependent hydrolase
MPYNLPMPHPYRLIRTRRHTIALTITSDAALVVRAPIRTPQEYIERLIVAKGEWIHRAMERANKRLRSVGSRARLTKDEIAAHKREAKRIIPERVKFYTARFGLADAVRSVKITSAAKRWGSCNAHGGLNFTWRLVLVPPSALDYVVIHELAHLTHRNHSRAFWASVRAMMPEYKSAKAMLSA